MVEIKESQGNRIKYLNFYIDGTYYGTAYKTWFDGEIEIFFKKDILRLTDLEEVTKKVQARYYDLEREKQLYG